MAHQPTAHTNLRPGAVRRLIGLFAAALVVLVGSAAPVAAQDSPTTLPPIEANSGGDGSQSIIPIPQASGSYEVEEGQPGSSSQTLAFVVIIGGLAVMVGLISLESKKKRAAYGISRPDPAALYEDDSAPVS